MLHFYLDFAKEAKGVMNTVGNLFSGQVVDETAKNLSERFGKVLQKRQRLPERGSGGVNFAEEI